MRPLLLLILCLVTAAAPAAVYRWVNKEGLVVYSDQPSPGAEEIKMLEPNTYGASPPPAARGTRAAQTPSKEATGYTRIAITSPVNEATIHSNEGLIDLALSIEPALDTAQGHGVAVLLDGSKVGEPQRQTAFKLNNVERGTHTLQVEVVDEQGKVLGTSNTVTVHLHQTSILNPNHPQNRSQ